MPGFAHLLFALLAGQSGERKEAGMSESPAEEGCCASTDFPVPEHLIAPQFEFQSQL